jgi:Tfp pilus assembly protein PilX
MRQRELRLKRARGFLLVVAILLLVVVAIAVAALGNMTSADIRASSGHAQSEQAYFAAKSGIEYASFQLGPGTPCNGSSIDNFTAGVGQGQFTTTSQTYLTWTATTNNPLAANATTVNVATTAAFAPHGRIWIDAEQMNYSGKTATAFTGVTRGLAGSTATAHALGSMVSQDQCLVKSAGVSGAATRVLQAAIARSTNKERAMMVYAKGTALTGGASDRRIYFRMWDPVNKAWLAEQLSAQQVANSASPIMFVLRFARTRNEAILGTLDGAGNLFIHIWNGATNAWSNPVAGGNPLKTGLSTATRGFQIAYEHANDRAIIVYANGAAANPQYAIWDGTSLNTTPAAGGFIHSSLGLGAYVTTNVIRWFRLATNRQNGSNAILMITFDSGNDVWGARWNGTNWVKMEAGAPAPWDTSAGSNNDQGAVDVAYESVSGVGLLGWADAANKRIRWRTWDPATSTLSGITTTTFSNFVTCANNLIFEWFRLYARPDSDEVMGVFQNTGRDLMSVRWDGSNWDDANRTCHGANTETQGERDFDFAWQTLPAGRGKGWIVWGSRTAAGGKYLATRSFTSPAVPGPGGAWGGVTKILDRTMMVKMGVLPLTGTLLAGLYQAAGSTTDDEQAIYADGGVAPPAWTATIPPGQTIWTGPTSLQQGERVYIETSPTASIILEQQEIYP